MKKLAAALAVCLLVFFGGCSSGQTTARQTASQTETTVLRVTYDSSLYGTDWMGNLVKAFEKVHPGITVKVTADSALVSHYTAALDAGADTPDVLFFARTDWQTDASSGLLASLETLYAGLGQGSELALRDGAAADCSLNGTPYVLPWGVRVGGLLYNETLFTRQGWTAPASAEALASLCEQIRAAGFSSFAWSSERAADWTDILDTWWAQNEGESGMQTFFAMQSAQVYAAAGRKTALETFAQLVTSENSYDKPLSLSTSAALKAFLGGDAVFLPAGFLSALSQSSLPDGFALRAVSAPAAAGAADSSLIAAHTAGYAAIPAKAAAQEAAKTFLAYFARESAQVQFTEDTATPGAFVMDDAFISRLPDAMQAMASLWQGEWLFFHSDASVYYTRLFDWPAMGSPVLAIFAGSRTAQQAYDDDIAAAEAAWTQETSG